MALFAPSTLAAAGMPPLKQETIDAGDIEVNIVSDEGESVTTVDPLTGIARTQDPDGSVTIDFSPEGSAKQTGHSENLADHLGYDKLGMLADELLRGIQADLESRAELEMLFQEGIALLGTRIEPASSDVTPQGTVSKVYHPILLKSLITYQANAQAELLPVSGPVKVRDDKPLTTGGRNNLADAFEKDFNHYLTTVRKEYYPDTRRMFTGQGYIGTAFKKIYKCPLRRAPVSDYVSAMDLIVSNDAVSLANAGRITHQSLMRPSVMKRMQYLGAYIDDKLPQPHAELTDTERAIKESEGLQPSFRQEDMPYRIYECYADIDMDQYGHTESKGPPGLPLPYRVTIDKDSRKVLEIRRNWREDDIDFKAHICFVKYGFVPSLGFYDWGLVHILGNTARALTAISRQLLDAGQFANFPGFLLSDRASRQETTQIRVPPGGGHAIKTGGLPIAQVAMPLPYKEPSAVLMALAEKMAEDGEQLGMAALVNVGEGRADTPVGTMVAMIEQATKVMSAIHKQNHSSQQEEFEKLKELFSEDPSALWKFAKNPARKWEMAEEFSDVELVPASDPNVPSRIHRIMMAQALVGLTNAFPQLNKEWALKIILTTLGYAATSENIMPPQQPGATPPDPKAQAALLTAQAKIKDDQMQVQLKAADLQQKNTMQQREAAQGIVHAQMKDKELAVSTALQREDVASRERIAQTQEATERMRLQIEHEREQHASEQLHHQEMFKTISSMNQPEEGETDDQ